MHQPGEFNPPPPFYPSSSSYLQQPPPPPPNPIDYHHHHPPPPQPPPSSYASAPPFSSAYIPPPPTSSTTTAPDYSSYPHSYPPIPDPSPPQPFSARDSHALYPSPYYSPPPSDSHYPNPNPNPNPNSAYDVIAPKYDYTPSYLEDFGNYGGYSERERFDYQDDGVYAYQGSKREPYGARGTASKSSTWSGMFDDYGRPISFPSSQDDKSKSSSSSSSMKVVKAVPKVETQIDAKSGVQKFRVKLLPESGGQGVMDVLCMVGLDGIRMLDPSTSRTLRIYPLDTVTRCDKINSSTFAFWSKTSVDVEPRRIRLQSNSYTTNTILDTVTAATVQFKEMGGRIRPAESYKAPEQPADKKKGFTDWINKLKPVNEEKDHWMPDEVVTKCTGCGSDFSAFNRRHHCRNCGDIFCDKCTQGRTPLTADDNAPSVRVCDRCMAEVSRRLSKAKEVSTRPVTLHSHEDLAKKLQEEMEKNFRISSGSKSEGSGRQMREVACPTCTVHLQVQVPSSGSETIECGVCQHPFLVSAH